MIENAGGNQKLLFTGVESNWKVVQAAGALTDGECWDMNDKYQRT